jgi:DHA1 family tetracycline resistance protein-like MFS transporter
MTNSQKATKASALFIFVTLVIEAMGFGIVMPVLPDVVRKFVAGEANVATIFGYFIAVYALLQFLFAPVLGRLSDKYGRRPVLLISLFGTGVDYVFMALAPSLGLLFIGRLVSGICGASYTVATAYLADISDDSNRAKNFGLIGAGFGLGFILGPAIGGIVASHGQAYPFLVSAGLNLLNFIFGLFVLPESLPASLRRDFSLRDLNPFKSLYVLTTMKSITLLVVAHVLIQLAGQTHPAIWAIYTEARYGWTASEVGISLAVVGIFHALVMGGLTGPLVKRFGEKKVSLWCSLGQALGFFGYGLAQSGIMVYGVLIATAVFMASYPALQSLISREIPAEKQGELQGALMSLTSLTAVVNPLLMTNIFALASIKGSTFYVPGMPYFLAGLFGLVAFAAIYQWEKRQASDASSVIETEQRISG